MKRSIIANTTGKRAIFLLFLALLAGTSFLMVWLAVQNAQNTQVAPADYDGDSIGDFVLLRFPNTPPVSPLNWYIYKSQGIAYTPPGSNVKVVGNGATVTFTQVTGLGSTTFTPISPPSSAGTPPTGFTILGSGPAINITTTATYTAPVSVCFTVSSVNDLPTFSLVRILHGESGQLVDRTILAPDPLAPDFATRRVCGRVTSLSPFVAAVAGPLAAGVEISGRVLTTDGRGVRSAIVNITDEHGVVRSAITGPLGAYTFSDVESGQTCVIAVRSRRFNYAPRVVQIVDNIADLNFQPEP